MNAVTHKIATGAAPPVITILGSCRVLEPLRAIRDAGLIRLNNEGITGYVHNTKEAIQKIRLLRGEIALPGHLKPYIQPDKEEWGERPVVFDFARTERFVVEISSLKEVRYKNFYLQINRLKDGLKIDQRPFLQRWWDDMQKDRLADDRAGYFAGHEEELSDIERGLVLYTTTRVQPEKVVVEDMARIVALLGKDVVFVTHFDTPTFEGAPIPIRADLVRYVTHGAERLGCPVYNPRRVIEAHGLREALLDTAHYQETFKEIVGRDLFEHCLNLLPSR